MNISQAICKIGDTVIQNKSTISTGAGVVGFVVTTVSAVKATPKAIELKKRAEDAKGEKLTPFELVKACYKPYVIPALEEAAAIGLVLYGKKIDSDAIKSMGAAYALSNRTCVALQDKLDEYLGKEKSEKVKEEVTKEVIADTYINHPFYPNPGEVLIMDPILGEVFSSTREKVEAAVDRINCIMEREQYVTYSEFFDVLNLDNKGSIKWHIGWNDYTGPASITKWTSCVNKQGIPCLVFKFGHDPVTV